MGEWLIAPDTGVGGGAALLSGSASRFVLTHGQQKRNLYWAGAGVGISPPGLPAAVEVSTSKHWIQQGEIYFSKMAPHRLNPRHSVEHVFSGNGIIVEIGAGSALATILGLGPLFRQAAQGLGMSDHENKLTAQLLLFNTNHSIVGALCGTMLADLLSIGAEMALGGEFSSIYTQAVACVASASTAVGTGGVSILQGAWWLPW